MSQFLSTAVAEAKGTNAQIFAKLSVRLSWKDEKSGERISTRGVTEHVSDLKALVNLDFLPPVGIPVQMTLSDEKKEIISVKASVIRVERNIAKPKAALAVHSKKAEWSEVLLPAAQSWVTNDIQVNYSDDDWLN